MTENYASCPSSSFPTAKHNAAIFTSNGSCTLPTFFTAAMAALMFYVVTMPCVLWEKTAISDLVFRDRIRQNSGIIHDFSPPMSNFRTFQSLKNKKNKFSNFRTFRDPRAFHKVATQFESGNFGRNSPNSRPIVNLPLVGRPCFICITYHYITWLRWRGATSGATGRALDLRSTGLGF